MYIIDKEIKYIVKSRTTIHRHTHTDEVKRALGRILRFTQQLLILSTIRNYEADRVCAPRYKQKEKEQQLM